MRLWNHKGNVMGEGTEQEAQSTDQSTREKDQSRVGSIRWPRTNHAWESAEM